MAPPRMSSDRLQPALLLARPLTIAGLLSLAVITLSDRGTSLMYAAPWSNLYWLTLVLPPALLLLRLGGKIPLRFPATSWLIWFIATAATLIAAAGFSPYRGPCLLWTALPLAGLVIFLLVHDWLAARSENRNRLAGFQTVAGGLIMLASIGYWLVDVAGLTRTQIFSAELFAMRNPHPLGHANYTAGLALLSLPWLLRATFHQRGLARLVALAATGLGLLALFMSGSRGGLLGLGALGVAAIFMAKLKWKRFLLFAGLVVAAAGLLAVANPRIRAMLGPRDPSAEPNISTVQRAAMLDAGLAMGIARPLLGWGPGSTPLAFPRFRQQLEGGAENVLQLHNTPVEILAGTGLAGWLASVFFLGLAYRSRAQAPVAAITLAGYAVFSLTDYQLDVPVFVFALAVLAAQLAPPGQAPASSRLRIGLALTAIATVILIAVLGQHDPTPQLNTEALILARDPTQSAQAIALLNQSLALNPDQEIAHFNLGWLLVVPDPPGAEKHFREAMRLVPDKGGVYFGIGLARLNQGNHTGAARALALECLNEPPFLASPWWKVPEISAEREATAAIFAQLATQAANTRPTEGWVRRQALQLAGLAPRLGLVSPGPEKNYRRERIGYPVLVRNQDIPPPVDLYDVREDPRFAASVPFPLPHKGWLPSPLLHMLLDDTLPSDK